MKTLYFDCTNGVSGDMVLKALSELGTCGMEVTEKMNEENFSKDCSHEHVHVHAHGRSYEDVKGMIENSSFSQAAKSIALNIYAHIADAESSVHGESLESIHFHEVGRDEAIKNSLGIGMALEKIAPDKIYTSPIYDGRGAVVCSHGEIPVPVPAVAAMMEKSTFTFKTAPVNTEMVTPSGLAALLGIGAERFDEEGSDKERPDGKIISMAEAKGSRNTGRDGLKVYLIEG